MQSKNSIWGLIKAHVALFEPFKHAYLFGSAIDPNITHNDIDILIVYANYSNEIAHALQVITDELEKASGLLVDLTALSIEEEIEIAFLEKINPHYLKIK